MTTTPGTEPLRWPGIEFPAVLTDAGWAHVEPFEVTDFGFDPPLLALPDASTKAYVLIGERLAALRALDGAIAGRLSLAYLDVPRLSHARFVNDQLDVSCWLSMVRSHVDAAARLVLPAGRLVLHVDDEGAALAMSALDNLLGQQNREHTILWQKKYSPQNDLHGRIDDAQDYLLVYKIGDCPPPSRLDSSWWPWRFAGKSEDGTREAEQLRDSGVISLPVIPKTSKPAQLILRLLEAFTSPGDVVLECFSDTAFASATAVTQNRVAVLLGGETASELDRLTRCSIPRLELCTSGAQHVAIYTLPSKKPTLAKVSATGQSIQLNAAASSAFPLRSLRPVLLERTNSGVVPSARKGFPPMAIRGDVNEALVALEPAVACDVTAAMFEWTALRVGPDEMRANYAASSRLLAAEGVVAIAVGHLDYGEARLIGEIETFGRDQYLGTVAVESGDNGSPMLIILFKGLPHARLGKIGMPAERIYAAEDGDPRGPWRDPGHKGARGGNINTAFDYRLPPYRWQLVGGNLPAGVWRLNPISGVIWAERLESAGSFKFTVRVTDSEGKYTESECTVEVAEAGSAVYPDSVWWMDRHATPAPGDPKITTPQLPRGVVGEPYIAVLVAEGGNPTVESTAPGEPTEGGLRTRYWEFSRKNLIGAILEDKACFGATGKAKPRIKVYPINKPDGTAVELSWWDENRLSGESVPSRLASMLSKPGDLILIVGRSGHDEILRSGRRCIFITDIDESDLRDRFPLIGKIGSPVALWNAAQRSFRPQYDSPDFETGLPWVLGFIPPDALVGDADSGLLEGLDGITADGSQSMVVLGGADWPLRSRCEALLQKYDGQFKQIQVLYFRGKPPKGMAPLRFRRIPFDIQGVR